MSTIVYRASELKNLLAGPQGAVANQLEMVASDIVGRAKVLCPKDSQELSKSIGRVIRVESIGLVAYVSANKDYAVYVHEGTGMEAKRNKKLIRPKNPDGVLAWPYRNKSGKGRVRYKNGKTAEWVYSKYSRGMKGRPFLADAAKQVLGPRNVRY